MEKWIAKNPTSTGRIGIGPPRKNHFLSNAYGNEQEEATRLVASFNACREIPVEALETGVIAEMQQALEFVFPHINEYVEWHEKRGGSSVEMMQAGDMIKAVLEKTGSAATKSV